MKKMLPLLITALILLLLVACNNTQTEVNNDNNDTVSGNNSETTSNSDDIETATNGDDTETTSNSDDTETTSDSADTETGDENNNTSNSIEADNIVFSSPFIEGLAFVAIKDDPYTAYCINKSGEIIFKIDDCSKDNTERGVIELGLRFKNGLMLFEGNIYDKSGTVTTPESLGVTSFIEWDGTYLVAEKITSDYASATKELGVLNKNFEWELSLSESHYTVFKADKSSFYDLLILPEAERDAHISIIDESVYAGFEKLFSTNEVQATSFKEIWGNRYVVATAKGSWGMADNIGILSLDGEWFAAPNTYLKVLYDENPDWFKNELLAEETRERNCLYVEHYSTNYIFINDGTVITAEDLSVDSILQANNDYILVQVRIDAGVSGILNCVGVMNYSQEWIVEPTFDNYNSYRSCDEIYFSLHYMVMKIDGVTYYYDLTTQQILQEKPDDLPVEDNSSVVDKEISDITQIQNYRMSTDFVDGKAAVLLLNPDTNELFVSIVGSDLKFIFEPQKLGVKNCAYPSLEFDGTHIVFFDDYNGTAQYPLGIYVYNSNGEKVTTLSTSNFNIDSTTSITCEYSEGIFVLSFNYGTYSAYYRQSSVKYYSIDGTPFEW